MGREPVPDRRGKGNQSVLYSSDMLLREDRGKWRQDTIMLDPAAFVPLRLIKCGEKRTSKLLVAI